MRVSDYFNLGRSQPTLSFVDVDVLGDTRLFISPRAVRLLPSQWGDECVSLIQSFFSQVLHLIHSGDDETAVGLLEQLREPNETHLGLSQGKSQGRALGVQSARSVWRALSKSEAAKSGLLVDLEDTVLMIDGISVDVVSDMVTNIIRGPLIQYTQEASGQYGIPLTEGVASGPLWDAKTRSWQELFVSLPLVDGEKLLLVPKEIVRQDMDYDVDKYYRHFILEHLRQQELASNSELVHVIKSGKNKGKQKVYIKDLKEKYGTGKAAVVEQTLANPGLLQAYREELKNPSRPLTHATIADIEGTDQPDWDSLLADVINVRSGPRDAHAYENAIESLLSALMYPALAHPRVQHELHDGRKRVDITYSNMGHSGFFHWLAQHYSCAHIFFECKNYTYELDNPVLDQLSGRFSPSRGQVGFIVCRQLEKLDRFSARCRDTAKDQRGYVMVLQDSDLRELVESKKRNSLRFFDLLLIKNKFSFLVD
ncbi:hypothetical protein [Tabrizicola sp.]|uniref:hypothetical protein n=1 Tax=Tabrizicola sp. TaxID=2005166 RepID=UPI00262B7381|nr:hypothetical protein [Tabrizicola sp.]MDM7930525.1 hypothetical protein [Tabrizicola sp.]